MGKKLYFCGVDGRRNATVFFFFFLEQKEKIKGKVVSAYTVNGCKLGTGGLYGLLVTPLPSSPFKDTKTRE